MWRKESTGTATDEEKREYIYIKNFIQFVPTLLFVMWKAIFPRIEEET